MNNFSERKYLIGGLFVLVVILFLIRLFNLQITDDTYKLSAENNSQRQITQYPARGLIYDRNGELLVYNQAAYDLMIVPRQLEVFDTTEFCQILGMEQADLIKRIAKAKRYSRYKPSIFLKQLSAESYAVLLEKLYKYPGFFVQTRTLRKYPRQSAAHVLGYLREVSDKNIRRDKYYKQGDYIGITGVENSYEKVLRGQKGVTVSLVDVHNRIKGSYKGGKYDKEPVVGKKLQTTLDIKLQEYGELLMQNKKGGIVAIEPSTGEILAKVSSPGYDPEFLVGRDFGKNYLSLLRDSVNPILDRTMMGQYAPGSIFKMVNALIGLQEGIITPNTRYECHNGYHVGRFTMGCHSHQSPLDLRHSIQHSCNAYYAYLFRNLLDNPKYGSVQKGFEVWRNHVRSFGFGDRLGADFSNELKGSVPTNEFYRKRYRTAKWRSLNVISLAIGQGELLITPLQMANMVATIANRGYYYVPHIVKSIGDEGGINSAFTKKKYTTIDPLYFDPVIDGMELVVSGGAGSTGTSAAIEGIRVCGKTGTVENNKGIDHSVFVAFAPRENPRIALVVYVENGKWGSWYGAPIAGLMIEKYLKGEIESPRRKGIERTMMRANLVDNPQPISPFIKW
jgi:penicillin-binding protein 2